jgi:ubiquinone/menaquinone biosynthesis C-methylase UbiE
MNPDQIKAYKTEVADYYSQRSSNYDAIEWHEQIARKLVDLSNIHPGAQVLDIATGTGMVALYAATRVGAAGSVIGIDISTGMLEKAKSKAAGLKNVRFELGDGEAPGFPSDSFDFIFCSAAFILMPDLHAALVHWKKLLKPDGKLGLHAFSENSFVSGVVAQAVLSRFGVNYLMSKPTGTVGKCRRLLEQAGYRNIDLIVDAESTYVSLDEAKRDWVGSMRPAPGQFPHPLACLTPRQLAQARAEYDAALEKINTKDGIENNMTTYYVYGEKPGNL